MKDFFVFTSIRNPLDRLVSAYFHFVQYPLKTNESEKDQNCYKYIKKHYEKYKDAELGGFVRFVKSFPEEYLVTINHFRPQCYFLKNKNGEVTLDHVMKVNRLQEDFDMVCFRLGKEIEDLNHAKSSEHLNFLKYYNNDLIDIVKHYYNDDFLLYDNYI